MKGRSDLATPAPVNLRQQLYAIMEVEQWYAIALGVLLAFFLLRQVWFILNRWAFPRLVSFFLRRVRYRLLLRGREWLPWTWFEAICLLFYLIASVFTELLFVENPPRIG